jgi:hypothetical protein
MNITKIKFLTRYELKTSIKIISLIKFREREFHCLKTAIRTTNGAYDEIKKRRVSFTVPVTK